MKRYSIHVTLYIVLIVLASVGGCILYQHNLIFSTIMVALIIVGMGIHLHKMQIKHIEMMQRLIDSIQFNDMIQTFPSDISNKMIKELANELSGVLIRLRQRVLKEEIKHQYYANLLNKVDTAVLVTETNGNIEWMNQTAINLLGHISHLPDTLIVNTTSETQVVNIEKNGKREEMAFSSTLFSAQGKEQLLISLKNIHSVLERNEMEAWQKLIRVLTHEIMNSIAPIISLSETLSEREMPEEINRKEYKVLLQAMQTIHRRSKGLLDFVENYRRLTRIPVPVYSAVSINELFSDLEKLFPDRNIHFEKPFPDIILNIDRALIEQVLINLIKNAKESSKKKSVDITIKSTGNKHITPFSIIVQDTGEGILPEVLDKIFVPFFTTKPSGSGIGLSLCKQIMNLHGGTIHVSSEIGKGTSFSLGYKRR